MVSPNMIIFKAAVEHKDAAKRLLPDLALQVSGKSELITSKKTGEIVGRISYEELPGLFFADTKISAELHDKLGAKDIICSLELCHGVSHLSRHTDPNVKKKNRKLAGLFDPQVAPNTDPHLWDAVNFKKATRNRPLALAIPPAFFRREAA